MPNLKDQAIKLALESNWEEAIQLNKEILEETPNDLDSLNRLAYAYMQSGKFDEAHDTYNRVLTLDTTNPIATKNLRKLSALAQQTKNVSSTPHLNHMNNVFIQEAGKTKTVELTNVADKKALMSLQHGDDIVLIIKRSKIFALSQDKTFIGMLPDSIGIRLIGFMKGGNEYQACVKGVDDKSVTIFIKETKRAKRYLNQSSFS
jgi:tetratricopeptide (TPR) repeat protein